MMKTDGLTPMKLIDDFELWRKFWSVRLTAFGAILMAIFTAWPDSVLFLWAAMPEEVKELIPRQFATGLACFIFIMSSVARVIKQQKLEALKNDTTKDE